MASRLVEFIDNPRKPDSMYTISSDVGTEEERRFAEITGIMWTVQVRGLASIRMAKLKPNTDTASNLEYYLVTGDSSIVQVPTVLTVIHDYQESRPYYKVNPLDHSHIQQFEHPEIDAMHKILRGLV